MEEKEKKSTVKYSRIFYYFWKETKGYRLRILFSAILVAAGSILGSVITPTIYQKMTDIIASGPLVFSGELKSVFFLFFFI